MTLQLISSQILSKLSVLVFVYLLGKMLFLFIGNALSVMWYFVDFNQKGGASGTTGLR